MLEKFKFKLTRFCMMHNITLTTFVSGKKIILQFCLKYFKTFKYP